VTAVLGAVMTEALGAARWVRRHWIAGDGGAGVQVTELLVTPTAVVR
jgi:hypothetical protein